MCFKQYQRKQIAELRPYKEGEILEDRISISQADLENGSPKVGDMIARNPKNHDDMWLVAKEYFEDNFEEIINGETIEPSIPDTFVLTNEDWEILVNEEYLELNEEKIPLKIIGRVYDGSRRHTEKHYMIFQRLDNNKYYRVDYQTSVKDEMDWNECNGYESIVIGEVFPKTEVITIYK